MTVAPVVAARGAAAGLTAAVMFGASAPLSTLLLHDLPAQSMAGLLYLGAAVVLGFGRVARRGRGTRLRRQDLGRLSVVVLAGGIVAPVLLLLGLQRTGGLTGSLLLNLEAPATLLFAVTVFGEHLPRRALAAAVTVLVGAAVVGGSSSSTNATVVGSLLVAGAALCWALDNNLSVNLAGRSPLDLVLVKCAVAGSVNLVVGLLRGERPGPASSVVLAMILGSVAYGLSVLLDAVALRELGAAREAGLFATAPFVGAVLSVPLLSESLSVTQIVASLVMAAGIVLLILYDHEHRHLHPNLAHEHMHRHSDSHHEGREHLAAHAQSTVNPDSAHSHEHDHQPLDHQHAHVSDQAHRHEHSDSLPVVDE